MDKNFKFCHKRPLYQGEYTPFMVFHLWFTYESKFHENKESMPSLANVSYYQ